MRHPIRQLLFVALLFAPAAQAQTATRSSQDLFAAIYRNDAHGVLDAISHGANPNSMGPSRMTALMSAATFGRPQMVHLLLAHGADPDLLGADPADGNAINAAFAGLNGLSLLGRADEPSPARHAAALDVLRQLLGHRGDPNLIVHVSQGDMSPLMLAAMAGAPDVVSTLLGGGAKVDLANRTGYTALDYAVDRPPAWATSSAADRLQCVRALLAAGAAVNRSGTDRVSPLSRSERAGQEDISNMLKSAGAREPR